MQQNHVGLTRQAELAVKDVFDAVDSNGNGTIDTAELRRVIKDGTWGGGAARWCDFIFIFIFLQFFSRRRSPFSFFFLSFFFFLPLTLSLQSLAASRATPRSMKRWRSSIQTATG
jgi:hypothetical protein